MRDDEQGHRIMDKKRWQQITAIADRALDLDPGDRLAFVKAECISDPGLRDEVIQFLEAVDNSVVFWDDMLESSLILADEISTQGSADKILSMHQISQAGPYRVIRLIASGGMSNVFLAERNDGHFQRQVAIKILRGELNSDKHIKLFLAEREILSSLEHPNIARLYDGGIVDGRPYLVMEYVEGEPINSYITKNNCTFETRMELFNQMCRAVESAHRNLIVHRDLKPDNIMVKSDGTVKILDFGIARVIGSVPGKEVEAAGQWSSEGEGEGEGKGKGEGKSNDESVSAGDGDGGSESESGNGNGKNNEHKVHDGDNGLRMFSIQYAAPEQITGDRITTSTDVYALGLLLYEMLTGSTPFDLSGKKRAEAEHIICNDIPARAGPKIPDSLISGNRKGDLEAIISKALQKSPDLRYATVDQLIFDIRRYMDGLPVSALAGTRRYRFRRFIGRHPGVVTAAFVAVIAAGAYMVTLNLHTARLNDERAIAETERDVANSALERAEREAARAESITNLLMNAFEQADPSGKFGADVTMRQILDSGAERALADLDDQPGLQADLLFTMAEVYQRMNVRSLALPLAGQALAIRENMAVPDYEGIFESRLQLARILGGGRAIQTNVDQALAIYQDLLPEAEQRYGSDDLRLGQFLVAYANAYDWDQHGHEKLEMFDRGIGLLRRSGEPEYQLVLAQSLTESANFEGHRHLSNDAALERLNEALQIRLTLHGRNHGSVATTMSNMALRLETIDPVAADTLMSQAVEIHRAWAGDSHTTTITLINNYAGILRERGDLEKAVPYYREALRLRQLHQPEERGANAYSHFGLGVVLIDLGRPAEAISHLEFVAETFGEDDFRGRRAREQLQRARDKLH